MPIKGNILFCPACNHSQPQINLINCEKCGQDLGAPNVNIVSTDDELTALENRYNDAKSFVASNGNGNILDSFENHFNTNVKAIINTSLPTLDAWIVKSGAYKTYHRAVEGGLRVIADLKNDRKRAAIDSLFYGTYGRDINFASLTLNEEGLESYGNCRIILNEGSIKSRSSILEENSFNFVKTHDINFETLNIPAGYRSKWHDKIKLTIAKLHTKLDSNTVEKDFEKMVLSSTGDKNTDDFIEVHIYKELTNLAAESIYIPTPKDSRSKISVKAIKEKFLGKINIV